MPDDLQQARVEAAAKAILEEERNTALSQESWPEWDELGDPTPTFDPRDPYRDLARAALAAADAHLPTVEQIAEEIAGHPIGSGFYQTTVGIDEAQGIAEDVLALFRGEVAGDG